MATSSLCQPTGPRNAKIMIVGEAPGANEAREGKPFIGQSGQEMDRMLKQVGVDRWEDCFVTNVARVRPPGNDITKFFLNKPKSKVLVPGERITEGLELLRKEIEEVKPNVIIAFGNVSLWALTGEYGIKSWRGSEMRLGGPVNANHDCAVVPSWHPAAVLRQWDWRFDVITDLRRAMKYRDDSTDREPRWKFQVRPDFHQVMAMLTSLFATCEYSDKPVRLAGDLETRLGHIACYGIAWSETEAISIPFMCTENNEGYWTAEQEKEIIKWLLALHHHPNTEWIFQNGLYDLQYFARHWIHAPRVACDTMIEHHLIFPNRPKGLDYISSLWNDYHRYWKDEGKEWNPSMDEDQLWIYNCKDCVATWEAAGHIRDYIEKVQPELENPRRFQMDRVFPAVFTMMLRGVRCNETLKGELAWEMDKSRDQIQQWIDTAVGHPLNVKSPKQVMKFFYEELGLTPINNRKTRKPTGNEEAMDKIKLRRPTLAPLTNRINIMRSSGVFRSTFLGMSLDEDRRIRCSYNIPGTETFRFSSSKSAFDNGTNLQNIPNPKKQKLESTILPNVRRLFIPDRGKGILAVDLDRADACVVAWEANDEELKQMIREGADLHMENAKVIYGPNATKEQRDGPAKAGVHATNYYCKPRTLAITLGITVHEAEKFQRKWFSAHPGIEDWHNRIEDQLQTTRRVSNKFGFSIRFFGRVDGLLPEALAWIPQSTVGLIINHGLCTIHEDIPEVEPLLQVHDELVMQLPIHLRNPLMRKVRKAMEVVVPYDDPLIITTGPMWSEKSWGDLTDIEWPAEAA